MRFDVIWRPEALVELAALWTDAADRNAVTTASNRIDESLARNPLGIGESREREDERIHFDPPLGVVYRVDSGARSVLVLTVGWSRPHG